jgi:hypothetical protein
MPRVKVYDYPEADGKITYYAVIISDLNRYLTEATTALNNISQVNSRDTVIETQTSAGPYYDAFITHKDNWFDDLISMKRKLENFVNIISSRINDAQNLKREWENKKKLFHWEDI